MKVKNKVVLFFILSFVQFSYAEKVQHIDINVKNLKEFQQEKQDLWDKYSSGIIAALTIFASLGISVWQARVSQRHSKALIISEARIKWIEELRPLLSKLIYLISEIESVFKNLEPFIDFKKEEIKENLNVEQKKEVDEIEKNSLGLFSDYTQTFNQVKLLLNPKVKEHKDLIDSMDNYIKNVVKEMKDKKFKNDLKVDQLIENSQIVLRKAWGQAKNEGDK